MDINIQRLKSEFEQISRFGALAGGGLTRLAFSREDKEARDFLILLLQKENFKIKIDDTGNIFAKFSGVNNPDLPPVSAGSHIDSVPQGGFYDGTLGVMAALEAIRTVRDSGEKLARPLELIVFVCEESSRFKMATVGSKIISGKLSRQRLGELKDKDGISLFDAMQSFGLNPANLKSCILPKSSFHSYIELHIEQGPVLQRCGIPVGIVTGIAAPVRYELRIEGRADHSGATPMDMRCDALACASEIVLSAERIAKESKTTVATTGYANAIPGVLNVIPGSCTLGLDIRDIDEDALRAADDKICAAIDEICARRGCRFELKNLIKDRPVKLSEEMIDLLESCAGELKIPSLRLPSGAGHDAMNMTELADRVGMLFVPCKDGISHNVNESINWHDAFAATKVLAAAMLSLAKK